MVDRLVIATADASGSTKDHTTIKCKLLDRDGSKLVSDVNGLERALLCEEFRSALLRVAMLDAQMPRLSEGIDVTHCGSVYLQLNGVCGCRLHVEYPGYYTR